MGGEERVRIPTKAKFYELWNAGMLGNKLRTWTRVDEALASGVQSFALRELPKAGGGLHVFVSRWNLEDQAAHWVVNGREFFVAEAADHQLQTLQGEVCRTYRGWEAMFGFTTLPMREAMAGNWMEHYQGAAVRAILRRFLDPSSLDDLDALFDLYPDAVVELSSFSKDVGCIPRRNTIIWEVRDY